MRRGGIRLLGVGFLILMLAGVWVTHAFFTKKFVSYDEVTLKATNIGLQLPDRADVKIRGVRIGEVLETSASADGATIVIGIDPDRRELIPANVTGSILPKTLFGEKYVSLDIPTQPSSTPIKAGAVVDKTVIGTEFEAVLNDLFPLLRSIDPVELNGALSAIATALEGRGDQIGVAIETADAYLAKLNPLLPEVIDDLAQATTVADIYTSVLPQIGSTLDNVLVTANTLETKETEVATLLGAVTDVSEVTKEFLAKNEKSLTSLARINDGLFEATARYSPGFPCLFGGLDAIGVREASAFRDYTLHIVLETLPTQPRKYTAADKPYFGEDRGPTCGTLPAPSWTQANPLRAVPDMRDGVQGGLR